MQGSANLQYLYFSFVRVIRLSQKEVRFLLYLLAHIVTRH